MIKKIGILLLSLGFIFSFNSSAQPNSLNIKTRGMDINVTFFTPDIVRVQKYPAGEKPDKESLAVIKTPENLKCEFKSEGSEKIISSDNIKVSINTSTGAINFYTPSGDLLLTDYYTSFTPEKHGQIESYNVRTGFLLEEEEPVYGIGQVMDGKLNRRNSKHHLQNENMFTYSPYFMSPLKGYAVYSDNYSIQDFIDNNQILEFSQNGDDSDYYFIYGKNPDGIISGLRTLTGKAPMLPLWAYGFFQSKERYKTQDEVLDILKKYREAKVPIDVMIQDWQYWPKYNGTDSLWNAQKFDEERYPNPKKWIEDIHKQNGRLLIVTWPGFGPMTEQYQKIDSLGHLYEFFTWPPQASAHPYDVFSEEARDIYWDYLNNGIYSYIGNDGWWLDSTEPDHLDAKDEHYNLMTAKGQYRKVKNAYSMMHNKGIAEHQRRTNPDKRVVILTRSGHIGQQRYGSNTWSGDVVSSWDMLAKQIPAALNFTLMGIPNWNSDIGGFFAWDWRDENGNMNPGFKDLYLRWAQFGAFTPMMRSHGTDLPREIWQFGKPGEPYYDAIADIIKLRYKLLPYIYSTSWDVSSNDGTFMRPLIMDFYTDQNTYDLGSEYMFGREILVAPVTAPDVKNWSVYLPLGTSWWNFWNNEKYSGGQTYNVPVELNEIPLFVKAGSILPTGPEVQYTGEKKWDNLDLTIYPGQDGSFILYEDEFDNYNYEQGKYSTIEFIWNDKDRSLTISDRKGEYPGMLKSRKFNVRIAGEAKTKTVGYKGKNTVIKF